MAVFGGLFLILFIIIVTTLNRDRNLDTLIGKIGYKEMNMPFADLQVIAAGIKTMNDGVDPYEFNYYDSFRRPYNYPPIWLMFTFLSWGDSWVIGFGLFLLIVYGFACLIITSSMPWKEGLLFSGFSFSPVCFLGIERGNTDLFVFGTITAFVLMLSLKDMNKRVFGYFLLGLSAVFKLFPLFAFASALRETQKRFFIIAGVAVGFLGIYLFIIKDMVIKISENTPVGYRQSYGYKVFPTFLEYINKQNPESMDFNTMRLISIAVLLLVTVGAYLLCRRKGASSLPTKQESVNLDFFRVGASIYLFTFLLGANYDYRLIFLLFCLPLLFNFLAAPSYRMMSVITLSMMAIIFWLHAGFIAAFAWANEFANWTLFGMLLFIFLKTLPEWAKDLVFFRKRAS